MSLLFSPYLRAADQSNAPIGGAFLSFYKTQTSTPQPIWADVNLTIPLQNPLPSDSNGVWPVIWLDDTLPAYKAVMQSPDITNPSIPGAIVPGPNGTIDPYNSALTAGTLNQLINPLTQPEINGLVTVVNFAYAAGVVDRYAVNAIPGVTDMTAASLAANAQWLQGGAPVRFQSGVYLVSPLTISAPVIFSGNASLKVSSTVTLNGPVTAPATKIFNLPPTGVIAYTGPTTHGSAYNNGTYTAVPLSGGSGSGALATVTISGGGVTSLAVTTRGTGYSVGDVLSAGNTNLGGAGSGFTVTVLSVAQVLGTLGNVDIYTRWFGDVADGNSQTGTGTDNSPFFSQALGTANLLATSFTTAPNRVITLAGAYRCNSRIFVGDNITWQGAGKFSTGLFCPGTFADTAGLIAIGGISSYPTHFSGFTVGGQVGGSGGSGIVSTKNACFLSDIWVTGFILHPGIVLSSTDNFLTNFACELNFVGLYVTASDVTVSDGTFYQNQVYGVYINNTGGVGNTDAGRVTLTNLREGSSVQAGYAVIGAQHVTFSNCHVAAVGPANTQYSVGGVLLTNASDIVFDGCTLTNVLGASTSPGYLIGTGCTDIVVTGGKAANFYDGLQANGVSYLNVTGGQFAGNTRHGLMLNGGNVQVTGVQSRNNTGAGIDSENVTAGGLHSIVGNQCISNNSFGIVANLTGAGAFTNVQSNMNRSNASGAISYTGTTANINQGAAPTNY